MIRSAFWSATTAVPVEPRLSTVPQYGSSGCTLSSSAAHVLASTTPVAGSSCEVWNALTAVASSSRRCRRRRARPGPLEHLDGRAGRAELERRPLVRGELGREGVVGRARGRRRRHGRGRAMSAFHTLASVTPVTGRPLDFWYSLTRASVSRP